MFRFLRRMYVTMRHNSSVYSCTSCQREKPKRDKLSEDKANVEAIVSSLIGAIPDTGKTLEEYRNERLKKYEKDYMD